MIPKSEISIHFYSVSYSETLNTDFNDLCENIPLGHSKGVCVCVCVCVCLCVCVYTLSFAFNCIILQKIFIYGVINTPSSNESNCFSL